MITTKKTIENILDNCHLKAKIDGILMDIDCIDEYTVNKNNGKLLDSNGSEFEVGKIKSDGTVILTMYIYDRDYEKLNFKEQVVEYTGHCEWHEPKYPVFVPEKWNVRSLI